MKEHVPLRLRVLAITAVAILVGVTASCRSKTTPTPLSFSGSVTDPSGDAGGIGHDVTAIAVTVDSGSVRVDVTFAPGALIAGDTDVSLGFDTDQNAATGYKAKPADAALIGYEYFLDAPSSRGSTGIHLFKASSATDGAWSATGLNVTYPSANVMRFDFPLSLIGNDDGKFALKAETAVYIQQDGTSGVIDTAPNLGLPPLVTQ